MKQEAQSKQAHHNAVPALRLPDNEIAAIRFVPAQQINKRNTSTVELRDGRGRRIPGQTVEIDWASRSIFIRTELNRVTGTYCVTVVPLDCATIDYRIQGQVIAEDDLPEEIVDNPSPNMADVLPPPMTIAQRRVAP